MICKIIRVLLSLSPIIAFLMSASFFIGFLIGNKKGYNLGYEHGFYDACPDFKCGNYWKIKYEEMLKKRKKRNKQF